MPYKCMFSFDMRHCILRLPSNNHVSPQLSVHMPLVHRGEERPREQLDYVGWYSLKVTVCFAALPSPSQRGPICYNCFQQQSEDGCNRVTVCPEDCVRIVVVTRNWYRHVYWTSLTPFSDPWLLFTGVPHHEGARRQLWFSLHHWMCPEIGMLKFLRLRVCL